MYPADERRETLRDQPSMERHMRVLSSSLIVLAIVSGRAESQAPLITSKPAPSLQSATPTRMDPRQGPTTESAAIGIRPVASVDAIALTQRRSSRRSGLNSNVVLMVVGGAAMIAGAAIGGDAGTIFMVGGAVVGLWGLYNFLQ